MCEVQSQSRKAELTTDHGTTAHGITNPVRLRHHNSGAGCEVRGSRFQLNSECTMRSGRESQERTKVRGYDCTLHFGWRLPAAPAAAQAAIWDLTRPANKCGMRISDCGLLELFGFRLKVPDGSAPPVDLSPVSNSKHHDLVPFEVEYDPIVTHAKSVRSQLRLRQSLCMAEGILRISKKHSSQAILGTGIKPLEIPCGPSGVNEPIAHRPKTCAWVFTLPAL
jgi:hypothetical protein